MNSSGREAINVNEGFPIEIRASQSPQFGENKVGKSVLKLFQTRNPTRSRAPCWICHRERTARAIFGPFIFRRFPNMPNNTHNDKKESIMERNVTPYYCSAVRYLCLHWNITCELYLYWADIPSQQAGTPNSFHSYTRRTIIH